MLILRTINKDSGDNESIVPDSDPDLRDIEVPWVGSSEVSSEHTEFWEEQHVNGANTVNDTTVTSHVKFLIGQLTLLT